MDGPRSPRCAEHPRRREAALAALTLVACAPSPVEVAIRTAPGREAALIVLQDAGRPLQEARVFAIDLAATGGLPASSLDGDEQVKVYIALYDQSLESLGLEAGELTLARGNEPHYPWPRAIETLYAEVDARSEAQVRPFPLEPSPLEILRIRATCPPSGLEPGRAPVRLAPGCLFEPKPRGEVCYAGLRPWAPVAARLSPGSVVRDSDARSWLYASSRPAADAPTARLVRVQLSLPGVAAPGPVEDLGLPDPDVGPAQMQGVLEAPFVRSDELEVFAAWHHRDGPGGVSDGRVFVAARSSPDRAFSAMREVASLSRASGELAHPFLLPDHRTLMFRMSTRSGLALARRASTEPGDLDFTAADHAIVDEDRPIALGPTLSCDGGHVIYGVNTGTEVELRAVQISSFDPPRFGEPVPLVAPRLPLGADLRVVEGPGCDALYVEGEAGLFVADRVECNTCGNGIRELGEICEGDDVGDLTCATALDSPDAHGTPRCAADCTIERASCAVCGDGVKQGVEACDGADLGGADCTIVAPWATGTLSCARTCGFETRSCTPPAFNGDLSGLEPGAPWPMFRGGPAHTGQTAVVGPSALRTRWTYPASGVVGGIVVSASGRAIFGTHIGQLHSVEPSGTRAWMVTIGQEILGSPALGGDGTIYVATRTGSLHAVAADGTRRWTFPTRLQGQVRGSPTIGADGTIYMAFPDGTLRAISPAGEQRWVRPLGAPGEYSAGSSPAIGLDGTLYVPELSDQSDELFAVSSTGAIVWRAAVGERVIEASPVVLPSGDILYGGRRFGPDGTPRGTAQWGHWGVTVGAGGVVVGGREGSITAGTLEGLVRWSLPVATGGPPPPIAGGRGLLYVVGWNPAEALIVHPLGRVIAREAGCRALDAPAFGADGTLYAGCGGGLRAFAP